jgi:uncharacterized protein
MHTQHYTDAAAFYADVESHLLLDEAVNNLALGITYGAVKGYGSAPSLMLATFDGESVVGAAVMTAPYNLILSRFIHPYSAPALVDYCANEAIALPGIVGTHDDTRQFAALWHARTGQPVRPFLPQYLYRLDHVTPPRGIDGRFRLADESDAPLLAEWSMAFQEQALRMPMSQERAQSIVAHFLNSANPYCFAVWEVDSVPVSIAAINRVTPHGANIAFVYTPPEQRRKGYAAAVTAAISQHALDSGYEFCALYTDADNTTTNHIYPMLGYMRQIEATDWRFG